VIGIDVKMKIFGLFGLIWKYVTEHALAIV
jgi:hypothetical protein